MDILIPWGNGLFKRWDVCAGDFLIENFISFSADEGISDRISKNNIEFWESLFSSHFEFGALS